MRAWRRVDRIAAAQHTERRQLARQVTTWVDEDGMLVIRGRLTPEAGAVVQRALEAAADQLHKESAGTAKGERCVDEVTAGQRRADALTRLARLATVGISIGPHTATPHWHGERFDVHWAIDVLRG